MKTEKNNLAARFLLGKLSEEERVEIEKEYFNNKNFFEDILIAENDLIDAYAAGNLSSEDQSRFESRLLLNPQQRQRVEFAKTLVKYASSQSLYAKNFDSSSAKSSLTSIISRFIANKSILSLSFAVATLVFFVGGIWLAFDKHNSQINQTNELAVSQSPQQAQNQESATKTNDSREIIETAPENAPSAPKPIQPKPPQTRKEVTQKKETPIIFSLILSPGLTRDAGTSQRFTIPAKPGLVKMRLKFEEGNFSSYHAALETVEGHQVWSSNKLKAQGNNKIVTILIPSKLLKNSDYILTLKGITKEGVYESLENYTFTINDK